MYERNFKKKKLWVSFHDFFSTSKGNFKSTEKLWNLADRRLLISEELGEEYCRLFGRKEFEIITDGIAVKNIAQPKVKFGLKEKYTIYFGGLLHIDYYPLFESFSKTLDELLDINKGLKIEFILRGTQKLSFLENRKFIVEYRPFTTDDDELRLELNEADLLYLPFKFSEPLLYKYSLSTKMVGYTGASGCIFYHGPDNNAVSNLLKKYQAAICCNSLNSVDIISNLSGFFAKGGQISNNAKKLAKDKFIYEDLYTRFWQLSK